MSLPRPDEESKVFFKSILPENSHIQVRPMFGNLAAFANGNMFAGLYGGQIFVRLPETERLQILTEEGTSEFSPMPGRPMKEYVALPEEWRQEPDKILSWINQSLAWVETMPEKVSIRKTNKKAK